jgi:hypothetical protein
MEEIYLVAFREYFCSNKKQGGFRVSPWRAFQAHGGFLPHSLEGGC